MPPTAMNGCDVCRYRTGCLFLGLTHILMVAAYHKSWPPNKYHEKGPRYIIAARFIIGGDYRLGVFAQLLIISASLSPFITLQNLHSFHFTITNQNYKL